MSVDQSSCISGQGGLTQIYEPRFWFILCSRRKEKLKYSKNFPFQYLKISCTFLKAFPFLSLSAFSRLSKLLFSFFASSLGVLFPTVKDAVAERMKLLLCFCREWMWKSLPEDK